MAIYDILTTKIDLRKHGSDCTFNGYLEDYLALNHEDSDSFNTVLEEILKLEPGAKIITNLRHEVSKNAVSNQIIRYKDIFKLTAKPIITPYIVYIKHEDGQERALLLMPCIKGNYLLGKGIYYCLTEPGSEFMDVKNEIVAIASNDPNQVRSIVEKMFIEKAGALQRNLDQTVYSNYDELKELAYDVAKDKEEEARKVLPTMEDRTAQIYQYVVDWFLLKKVLYVQYMVNKTVLKTVHEGDVKSQRNQAKSYADQVPFISYPEMWKL